MRNIKFDRGEVQRQFIEALHRHGLELSSEGLIADGEWQRCDVAKKKVTLVAAMVLISCPSIVVGRGVSFRIGRETDAPPHGALRPTANPPLTNGSRLNVSGREHRRRARNVFGRSALQHKRKHRRSGISRRRPIPPILISKPSIWTTRRSGYG